MVSMNPGFILPKTVLVFSCGYRQAGHEMYKMANFWVGQAKLAILKSHKARNGGQDIDMLCTFKSLLKTSSTSRQRMWLS